MSQNEVGIKIILLGETGVGKTNLIRVFFGMEFKENFLSSSSSDCFEGELKYNDKSYKFFLWDTAGQEKYRAINKMFFRDAKIILIVYSIVDKHSFDEVDFWIKYVKENLKNEKYIIALIANKNDLYEQQIVMDEDGKEVAEKYEIDFLTTSAKTDAVSFKEFVNKLIINYINMTEGGSKEDKKDNLIKGIKMMVKKIKNVVDLKNIIF